MVEVELWSRDVEKLSYSNSKRTYSIWNFSRYQRNFWGENDQRVVNSTMV